MHKTYRNSTCCIVRTGLTLATTELLKDTELDIILKFAKSNYGNFISLCIETYSLQTCYAKGE